MALFIATPGCSLFGALLLVLYFTENSEPESICTETFLFIGIDLNLNDISAANLSTYMRTRFARFLHSLAKISQHGTAKTYAFIPVQDFTPQSDIDWTQSVPNIDRQLYAKYGLDEQ